MSQAAPALAVLVLIALFPQEDFPARVRTEGPKVWVDEKLLFEGQGQKAEVSVAGAKGWKQVVIVVDGQERARLPVPSLQKPVAWPPVYLDDLKPALKKVVEDDGRKQTLVLSVCGQDGTEVEIYRGPVLETKTERMPEGLLFRLDGEPYYRLSVAPRPRATPQDVAAHVNAIREKAGVSRIAFSAEISRACDLHALYVTRNPVYGLAAHEESPSGVGYTPEGARSGARGLLSQFRPIETPRDAVDGILATLYHRVGLFEAGATEIGVGWAFKRDGMGQLVLDLGTPGPPKARRTVPILWPVPDQTDVPLEFGLGAGEQPNPMPEPGAKAGYPVTLHFPASGWNPLEVEARLSIGGRNVPCWVSTPERPARKDRPQPLVVCLIPRDKLKPSTTYTVGFSCRQGGVDGGPRWSREWAFTTAR
jgi:hypothetical protein